MQRWVDNAQGIIETWLAAQSYGRTNSQTCGSSIHDTPKLRTRSQRLDTPARPAHSPFLAPSRCASAAAIILVCTCLLFFLLVCGLRRCTASVAHESRQPAACVYCPNSCQGCRNEIQMHKHHQQGPCAIVSSVQGGAFFGMAITHGPAS